MAEDFLTIQEVARILGCGQRTTCDLARSGQLARAVKVGGQWRVSRDVFMHWVDVGGPSPVGARLKKGGRGDGAVSCAVPPHRMPDTGPVGRTAKRTET